MSGARFRLLDGLTGLAVLQPHVPWRQPGFFWLYDGFGSGSGSGSRDGHGVARPAARGAGPRVRALMVGLARSTTPRRGRAGSSRSPRTRTQRRHPWAVGGRVAVLLLRVAVLRAPGGLSAAWDAPRASFGLFGLEGDLAARFA